MKPNKLLLVLVPLLGLGTPSGFGLDLTPHILHCSPNEVTYERVFYQDGLTRYELALPGGTQVFTEPGATRLAFDGLLGSSFLMRSSPQKPDLPFEGQALDVYRQLAMSLAPRGATRVGDPKGDS